MKLGDSPQNFPMTGTPRSRARRDLGPAKRRLHNLRRGDTKGRIPQSGPPNERKGLASNTIQVRMELNSLTMLRGIFHSAKRKGREEGGGGRYFIGFANALTNSSWPP